MALARNGGMESEKNSERRLELGMSDSIERRREEWSWLLGLVGRMPGPMLAKLVAHRGFHCIKDGTHRPIENTLEAYETAWTAGLRMCECDIALTKDGFLVLAHDSGYARLALLPTPVNVTDMTYRELLKTRLLSGARPPLLSDALGSADVIADAAKMVIEIKPGNADVPAALYRLLKARPELVSSIAVVMSFDLDVVHKFAELFGDGAIPGARQVKLLFLTVAQTPTPAPAEPWECAVNICESLPLGSMPRVPLPPCHPSRHCDQILYFEAVARKPCTSQHVHRSSFGVHCRRRRQRGPGARVAEQGQLPARRRLPAIRAVHARARRPRPAAQARPTVRGRGVGKWG